jgi:hydrogenase nickel incorporation protein HypB
MVKRTISIVENILNANDQIAAENKEVFDKNKVFTINLMASPGAGKTSLIIATIQRLREQFRIGVIEGDTAPVTIDADKIDGVGIPVVQINTGGNCHLDAVMVQNGIPKLPMQELDILIIENVGNLVCPASFLLGAHVRVVVASVPEGDDKPYKYPGIYRNLQALIVNKSDLLPFVDFNMEYFKNGILALNPHIPIFPLSCKTGEGFSQWTDWLTKQVVDFKN